MRIRLQATIYAVFGSSEKSGRTENQSPKPKSHQNQKDSDSGELEPASHTRSACQMEAERQFV